MLFQERQVFIRRWWPLVLGPAVTVAALAWLVPPARPIQPGWLAVAVTFVAFVGVAILLTLRLDTRLDQAGVHYRLFPLHWRWQFRPWAAVARAYVRTYDPLGEYGGWGLKGRRRNYALTISGDQGLQLELADGRRLLLGTQRPAEITQALQELAAPGPTLGG